MGRAKPEPGASGSDSTERDKAAAGVFGEVLRELVRLGVRSGTLAFDRLGDEMLVYRVRETMMRVDLVTARDVLRACRAGRDPDDVVWSVLRQIME